MADDSPSRPASFRSRTFSALGNPSYRCFYVGQGISLIGTWLQAAAVNWLVFKTTNSELWLGIVAAASVLPGLVVGIFAGALADRVVPRAMILAMEVGQMCLAFILAALVGMGVAQVSHLAIILAITRVFVAFEMPSRQVFLFQLVGRKELTNAIALNSSLFNASRVLGPALAGVCFASLGATACFIINGLSYVAAIATLLMIPRPPAVPPPAIHERHGLLGGFTYVRRDPRVAGLFLLMTLFGIVGMGYDAMIPAYARRIVHTGVGGYSTLLSCSGIGATAGALMVASLGAVRRKERLVLSGLILFAISLAASAMIPFVFRSDSPSSMRLALACVCLFGVGFGAVVFYSATQTLIQISAPDHLRGRIMGIWMIAFSGSIPLGSLWTGQLALQWGLSPTIGCSAILCLLMALAAFAVGRFRPTQEQQEPTVLEKI